MNSTTMKYAKSVMQLEKGLPPNAVVPVLKEKVEVMRERVSLLKFHRFIIAQIFINCLWKHFHGIFFSLYIFFNFCCALLFQWLYSFLLN